MVTGDLTKSSWVEEVENSEDFPPPVTKTEGNSKTITQYCLNKDDKRVKVVSYFKIEKHRVAKSVAVRKTWKKFGLSKNDKDGPNPATTISAEDVQMQFLSTKEEEENEESLKKKLRDEEDAKVKCRHCNEDHWSVKCPYKDTLGALRSSMLGEEKEEESASTAPAGADKNVGGGSNKYVPPSKREGAGNRTGDSMGMKQRDDRATVRVTNLSENTKEDDLRDLFEKAGDISRIFLAKDKHTQASKGFAFINFKSQDDAKKAIQLIDGIGYDHLILQVEWAKPPTS